jgi:hypothetical protein
VVVSKFVDEKTGNAVSQADYGQLKRQGKLKNIVPPTYSDSSSSTLTVDVKEGDTQVVGPLDLKSK